MKITDKNKSQIKLEGSSVADEMALLWMLAGLIIIFLKLYFSPILSVQLSCQRTETKDMTPTAQCLVKEYWFWGLYKRDERLVEDVSGSYIEIRRGRHDSRYCTWGLKDYIGSTHGQWGGGDCAAMIAAENQLKAFLNSNQQKWTYNYKNFDGLPSFIVFIVSFPFTVILLLIFYFILIYPLVPKSWQKRETLVINRSARKIIWENPQTKLHKEYDFCDVNAIIVEKYIRLEKQKYGRYKEMDRFNLYFDLDVSQPPQRVTIDRGLDDTAAESLIKQITEFIPVKIQHQQLSRPPEED